MKNNTFSGQNYRKADKLFFVVIIILIEWQHEIVSVSQGIVAQQLS